MNFAGQTILVTGAATGLGDAIVEAFGAAGAALAINDLIPHQLRVVGDQPAWVFWIMTPKHDVLEGHP